MKHGEMKRGDTKRGSEATAAVPASTATVETARFQTRLLRPAQPSAAWAFVVLPQAVSALLPRRGRVSVQVNLNGHPFVATLEPDGHLSHWLRIQPEQLETAGVRAGDVATFSIAALQDEPEPAVPDDLAGALAATPGARAGWDATTTLARVDWIHWIESAKQAKTRAQRIHNACDMLASGKRRVCCFDPSGHYSKAFSAPIAKGEP